MIETNTTKLMPYILNLVKVTTGDTTIQPFPTFFIDTDFKAQDGFTREEVT